MNPVLKQLAECGQSIWYDNVQRGMLASDITAYLPAVLNPV